MRSSRWIGDIAMFALVAVVVYVVGAVLLAAWPMWAMMGFGSFWWLALLAVVVAIGAVSATGRGDRRVDAGSGRPADRCPNCPAAVEPDYVLCPECHTALRTACPECRRPLQVAWSRCPYCGAGAVGAPSLRAEPPAVTRGGEQGANDAVRNDAVGAVADGRR